MELNPLKTIAMINVKRTKNDKVNLFMFFDFNWLNVELIITFTIYYINEINVIFLLIIDYCSKFIKLKLRKKKFNDLKLILKLKMNI